MKETEVINALNGRLVTVEEIKEKEAKAIGIAEEYLGKEKNTLMIIAYEEIAELQQALTKHIRGKTNRINIIEECADVMLGIAYISRLHKLGIDIHREYEAEKIQTLTICHRLSVLQEEIYKALNNEKHHLHIVCIKTLRTLATVKKEFNITNDEINKVINCKIYRLLNRIENQTKI